MILLISILRIIPVPLTAGKRIITLPGGRIQKRLKTTETEEKLRDMQFIVLSYFNACSF
jgi:hypothetical protein